MNILNWREFAPGLYSAGQPAPGQWPEVRAGGVDVVINLRPDNEMQGLDEGALVRQAGLIYHQLPIADGDGLTVALVDAFAKLLDARNDEGVLIHCGSANRVGALVALTARRHWGATTSEALDLGRRAGLTGLEPKVKDILRGS